MTSVKDVVIETPPTFEALGRGRFRFSDAYSVFDWGKMPDTIEGKGASLCTMGAYTFEALQGDGVSTHYRGVVTDDGPPSPLGMVQSAPDEMAIDLVLTPELPYREETYDYEAYHAAWEHNYLVPLEVVFRNRVPIGSSLRRRSDPADHGLDYEEWPEEPVDLAEPIVEFSTKFEESDRYLDRAEADEIAGAAEIDVLEDLARSVNEVITALADECGLVHDDGKIEVAWIDGELHVADVAGTLDENRFAYDGQQLSKEVLRQHYKRVDLEWVEAVAEAKERARAEGVADWRKLCSTEPDHLEASVLKLASDVYTSAANAYTDRTFFDAPDLQTVVESLEEL
jgi:phosphoribosylaminoimidazole-succinocarboxamide synthase